MAMVLKDNDDSSVGICLERQVSGTVQSYELRYVIIIQKGYGLIVNRGLYHDLMMSVTVAPSQ
jgi:hypothetical protein